MAAAGIAVQEAGEVTVAVEKIAAAEVEADEASNFPSMIACV